MRPTGYVRLLVVILVVIVTTVIVYVLATVVYDDPRTVLCAAVYGAVLLVALRRIRHVAAIVASALGTLLAAFVILVVLYLTSFPRWTVRVSDTDMKRWIKAELPRRADQMQVRAFLLRHQIPAQNIYYAADAGDAAIFVTLPNVAYSFACGGKLEMTFNLNAAKRLTDYQVEEHLICL